MVWYSSFYFTAIITAVILTGAMAVYAWRHKSVPGAVAYMWITIGVSTLGAFEVLSMISPSRETALVWFNLRFVSLSALPGLWVIFVLLYFGKSRWVTVGRVAILFLLPLLTLLLLWTNSLHGLVLKHHVDFQRVGAFLMADTTVRIYGPWMMIYLLYTYLQLLTGLIFLLIMIGRLSGKSLRQAFTIGAGAMMVIIGSLFPTFHLLPENIFNPLTLSFSIGVLVMAWGVFHGGLLESAPVLEQARRFSVVLAGLFLLLACAIVCAGYIYFYQFEKNYRAQVEYKLSAVVELKANEIAQWRRERLADASVLHNNVAVAGLVRRFAGGPRDRDASLGLKNWLGKFRDAYHYRNVLLLSSSGTVLLSAARGSEDEYQDASLHVREMKDWQNVSFLDFHRRDARAPINLILLVPVVDRGGRLGVLAIIIDPETYLYPLLQLPTPGHIGETFLVRREGDSVLYLSNLKHRPDAALNLRLPLTNETLPAARAVLGRKGTMEGVDFFGRRVLAALKAVPDSPWFMVTVIDKAEVLGPVRARFWLMFFGIIALIGVTAVVVWFVWRRQRDLLQSREREATKARQTSEEKFRRVFMTSPDAIAITRLTDGVITAVNPGFLRLSGYAEEELIGRTVAEMRIWENDPDRIDMIRELRAKGIAHNFETRVRKKYGAVIHTLTSSSMLELEGAPHVLTMTRDITERILDEEVLRESERRLREAQKMAHLGFWRWNVETGAVEWSEELFKIYGLDPGEFIPRVESILALSATPADRRRDQEIIYRAIASRSVESFEQMFLRPDQSTGYCYSTVQGNYSDNGELTSVVGTVLDITERKLAEEKIRRLNEELEEKVNQRTAELMAQTAQLERINKVFVDRELRMRELKARMAQMKKIQSGNCEAGDTDGAKPQGGPERT